MQSMSKEFSDVKFLRIDTDKAPVSYEMCNYDAHYIKKCNLFGGKNLQFHWRQYKISYFWHEQLLAVF